MFFGKAGKLATVEGHISAVLALKCQRCLEAVEWPVTGDIHLGIVGSLAQADRLPEGYEPLMLEDEGKIPLKNIVEDELLLSLPSIPKHDNDCSAPNMPGTTQITISKPVSAGTENPFSILTELSSQKKLETTHGSTKK